LNLPLWKSAQLTRNVTHTIILEVFMTLTRTLTWLASFGILALSACNGTPPEPPPSSFTPEEARRVAMNLWRDDDRVRHPKGSCSGCHGADFYDLARIGSTETDIVRRAKIDGATPTEAAALARAIQDLRAREQLPAENPRAFRPFQPGGAPVVGATSLKRDINFAKSLEPLLPTLWGTRIDSLEDALRARDELLDLASGTNAAGANPNKLDLRSLATGIQYPLWSADLAQGELEGTMNDWLADIALDAKPDTKAQWHALQDAYLENPSDENFWRMYNGVAALTQTKPFDRCEPGGINPNLACGALDDFARHKLRSAMIGQHLMRTQHAARDGFVQGALAFSYLDRATYSSPSEMLPGGDMWLIGDSARTMLGENQTAGTLRATLSSLGLPQFVQDSVSVTSSESLEQHRLRLTWFWIGFTFDPSFARIHGSNSTKVGEYMVGSLIDENMHLHNAFSQHVRLVVKGFLPEANVKRNGNSLSRITPGFLMNYSYFVGYGRPVIRWNEDRKNPLPAALKLEQEALWQRFVSNGFRMSLYLQLEALETADAPTKDRLLNALRTLENGAYVGKWAADAIKPHFDTYEPKFATYTPEEHRADLELMNALNAKLEIPTRY
jgi:hypothetical protein